VHVAVSQIEPSPYKLVKSENENPDANWQLDKLSKIVLLTKTPGGGLDGKKPNDCELHDKTYI
jgi:hypothetical protein